MPPLPDRIKSRPSVHSYNRGHPPRIQQYIGRSAVGFSIDENLLFGKVGRTANTRKEGTRYEGRS